MWKQVPGYGVLLAAGALGLQWLDYQRLARMHAGDYARALLARQQAQGASAEALAKLADEMARFRAQYAQPLYRYAVTFTEIFPVGVLVSLVSAARPGRACAADPMAAGSASTRLAAGPRAP
jgi:hypothetical protein